MGDTVIQTVLNRTPESDDDTGMRLVPMLGVTAMMCVVIAGLLWFLVPSIGQFSLPSVVVHSLSIGLTAALLTTLVTQRLDSQRRASVVWLSSLLLPVSFFAFVVGTVLARWILGLPFAPFGVLDSSSNTASLITTVVATAVCTGFFMSRSQINRLKLQAAEDGKRIETAKLAMLQAQIEPHMLFNTLANLRALISVDPERAVLMVDQLDAYLRTTLAGSRNTTSTLSSEFTGIENYLAIMHIRLGERLSYTLDLPECLQDTRVPSLLLQPVVENALLHGIEPAVDGGHLSVSARIEEGVLCLEVADTGVGFKDTHDGTGTNAQGGFGLQSLHERLPHVIGGPGVHIESPLPGGERGTSVVLRLEL